MRILLLTLCLTPTLHAAPLTSAEAVAELRLYLQIELGRRPPLEAQAFASVPLTKADARIAADLLWERRKQVIRRTRTEEMRKKVVTYDGHAMPFFSSVTGDAPESGRSLYISMHGGGGAPQRVNDAQWENQKRLYRVPEGVYLAPRAPTDTWNLWHQPHVDVLLDRLITNLIVFENVDPNRVYLMGYSAGGDGVYQLAPRMADRFAAASMMAGHPNDASPLNLRNLPFSIHVGERDGAYNRNRVAQEWSAKLDALQKADPDGYTHWTKIYKGKGHWMDREDAAAVPWMAKFTRDPFPKRIVWEVRQHPRFYWLAVPAANRGMVIRATRARQRIELTTEQAERVLIRLNDEMFDLDESVMVVVDGKTVHEGRVERTIATLHKTLAERGDPRSVFSGELEVIVEQE